MSFLTASLISGGVGLLGGALNSQRKFKGFGDMDALMAEFAAPGRNLDYFQRLAQDAGPSRNDLLSLAAATGGSQAAASGQARQMQAAAAEQGLNAYNRYKQSLDSLRANLATNKAQIAYGDFSSRRDAGTSLFNNIAQMGLGYAGNMMGQRAQMDWMKDNGILNMQGTSVRPGNWLNRASGRTQSAAMGPYSGSFMESLALLPK